MKPGPSGPHRPDWRATPHPSRLADDHPRRGEILAAHDRACTTRLSTYRDPLTGYSVFTADYLAERGYCCSQGCRHCPWEGGGTDPTADPRLETPAAPRDDPPGPHCRDRS